MRWIYLSPHFDDAVLSCGGVIFEQSRQGIQTEIWTIFAGSPPHSVFSLDPNVVHYGELTITGSSGHTAYHLRRALDAMDRGMVDVKRLITHRFPLAEIGQALEARQALEGLKHVVIMP